jgi:aminoglycoside phosphotransferase (APT) family kinase protein
MTSLRLHDDEFVTDTTMIRRLLAGQFPRWADLPLTRIGLSGTMNQLYRLGDELLVRLPRRDTNPAMALLGEGSIAEIIAEG